jgi:hypothetical protein
MSPAFESFLARLYVDGSARARFLADPRGEAAAAGLIGDEIAAAVEIDRVGLELAARSFAHKKRRQTKPAHSVGRLWRNLRGRLAAVVRL